MIRRVFVPLDGSLFGEQALPLAASIAARAKAEIDVAEVFPQRGHAEVRISDQEEYLDVMADRLARETGLTTTCALLGGGTIADKLVEHIEKAKADCVVMTTHGRGPLTRVYLGSVADELVKRLHIPIVVIKPRLMDFVRIETNALPKHVLIALDGSEASEAHLRTAAEWVQLFGAKMTILRVVEPVDYTTPPMVWSDASHVANYTAKLIEKNEKSLGELVAKVQASGLTADYKVLVGLDIASLVVQESQKSDYDMIIMGTHGRRGINRVLQGSIADRVVRGSLIPVLVLHVYTEAGAEPVVAAVAHEPKPEAISAVLAPV